MKKIRLKWAKEHQNWTENDWRNVIYSDESKFNVFNKDGLRCVRRKSGEKYHEKCITHSEIFTFRYGLGVHDIIWSGFASLHRWIGECNYLQKHYKEPHFADRRRID